MNKEMKQYTGTKTVKAMPMKYVEANRNGAILEMKESLYAVNPDGYLLVFQYQTSRKSMIGAVEIVPS